MTFRIVIVDDHRLVREGLIDVFADDPDFEVVGEGASADDALALVSGKSPDIVLLDVNMPGGGVDAARRITAASPAVRVVMFSFRQDKEIVRDCLDAGAMGYVVKGATGRELTAAVRTVLGGARFVDPKLATVLRDDPDIGPLAISAPGS